MTKVTYVGNPDQDGDGPKSITMKGESRGFPREGVDFTKGVAREVPDEVAEALKGNNHFEVEGHTRPPPKPKPAPKLKPAPEAEPDDDDDDDD